MIYHVVSPRSAVGDARLLRAQQSWAALAESGKVRLMPLHMEDTALDIGDSRNLPKLSDLLWRAWTKVDTDDIIMLTNDDNILEWELPDAVEERLHGQAVVCSGRVNLPDKKPDHGRDLFAFKPSWFTAQSDKLPDIYIGEMEWDLIMGLIVRQSLGIKTKDWNHFHRLTHAELMPGLVLHERHEAVWKQDNMKDAPAKQWNRLHAREWYARNNLKHLCTV